MVVAVAAELRCVVAAVVADGRAACKLNRVIGSAREVAG